jgi:hypothetical protein
LGKKEGQLKKAYSKPALVKRDVLSKVTAGDPSLTVACV